MLRKHVEAGVDHVGRCQGAWCDQQVAARSDAGVDALQVHGGALSGRCRLDRLSVHLQAAHRDRGGLRKQLQPVAGADATR